MDLRGIANSVSSTVNSNIPVTVMSSNGYTKDPVTLRQVPTYTSASGPAQVQALDSVELKQLDGLNIQGSVRGIYLRGPLAGVIRPDSKGGDLIVIAASTFTAANLVGTWLVVKVLESWPDWSKAAIVYQGTS
jgi:hypothetical protein